MTTPILSWDDFTNRAPHDSEQWASSDRGWVHLEQHPDDPQNENADLSKCCGNYLDYETCGSKGPNGETIHACAYVFRIYNPSTGLRSDVRLGASWHHDIPAAKAAIEDRVSAYLDRGTE